MKTHVEIGDLVLDVESISEEDIKLGAYAYCIHPSTDVLCVSWRYLHEPVGTERIWFPVKDSPFTKFARSLGVSLPDNSFPDELAQSLARGDRWWAHNAFFERCFFELVMTKKYGWPSLPFDVWWCSAALSAYHGYSQSLERSGLGIGVDVTKDTDGGALMKKMSSPSKHTKDIVQNWDRNLITLGEYCKTDVASEADVINALPEMPETEREIWLLDQKINWAGLPLDRDLAEAGAASSDLIQADARARLPQITDGKVTKPGEIKRIKKFVESRIGEKIPNLQACTVTSLLSRDDIDDGVKEVLRLRQDAGTAAIKKYIKETQAIKFDPTSRFHGGFVYYGAHTGRPTGQIVQPSNMPRAHFNGDAEVETGIEAIKSGDLEQMEAADAASMEAARALAESKGRDFDPWRPSATNTLTKCVRPSITAPDEKVFVAADWAGIELRMLTWFARDKVGIDRIIKYGSSQLYLDMAEKVFGCKVTKDDTFKYTVGKAGRLGCGYGMGPYKKVKDPVTGDLVPELDENGRPFGGFVEYARNYGIEITKETLGLADKVVKTYRKNNPKVKALWDDAHKKAVSVVETGYPEELNGVKFSMRNGALVIRLPSGRELFYVGAKVEKRKGRKSLSYWGDKSGRWVKLHLYGGLIIENIIQAMARDLLMPAMLTVDKRYPVVSHCYDEIVCEVLRKYAEECAAFMDSVMCRGHKWCKGLPLETETWIGRRYRK